MKNITNFGDWKDALVGVILASAFSVVLYVPIAIGQYYLGNDEFSTFLIFHGLSFIILFIFFTFISISIRKFFSKSSKKETESL